MGNLMLDDGSELITSGSRKIRAMFINSTPLLSKRILHTSSGGFHLGLGGKGLYNLDSIVSMASIKYCLNTESDGLWHNLSF